MRAPNIPRPILDTRRPGIVLPPKATDCHAHVFGPQHRFSLLPKTHFVPHECLLPAYQDMLGAIGCERAVLVQPSVYGTDNSAIEEAMKSSDFELRGVAVVSETVTDNELERLHGLGFRGIRINTASGTPGLRLEHARKLAERIKGLGWHMQFYVNFRTDPHFEEELAKLPITIVIDHFGRILTSQGLESPAFQAVLRLLERDNCYAKLMGPYFISDSVPDYPDILPFAQAMINTAPERVVWGSDWPHASAREKMPNDGDLVDMLAEWASDEKQRHRILVENPQTLYGFSSEA
jgi:2-pyrone-4,6-dicarboxylate lactonase